MVLFCITLFSYSYDSLSLILKPPPLLFLLSIPLDPLNLSNPATQDYSFSCCGELQQ